VFHVKPRTPCEQCFTLPRRVHAAITSEYFQCRRSETSQPWPMFHVKHWLTNTVAQHLYIFGSRASSNGPIVKLRTDSDVSRETSKMTCPTWTSDVQVRVPGILHVSRETYSSTTRHRVALLGGSNFLLNCSRRELAPQGRRQNLTSYAGSRQSPKVLLASI
jgi:hypothetical protein